MYRQLVSPLDLHLKTASIGLLSITFSEWFVGGYMYMYSKRSTYFSLLILKNYQDDVIKIVSDRDSHEY